jgi:hypothetical protein
MVHKVSQGKQLEKLHLKKNPTHTHKKGFKEWLK